MSKGPLGILSPAGFPGLPESWKAEALTWNARDGEVQLFCHHFFANPPRHSDRAMIILHGRAEHGGRYLHFPHYLHSQIDHVYALDMRGHGRSGGSRGHLDRFRDAETDLEDSISEVHRRLREKGIQRPEIHLFCHSLGGLVGLRTVLANPNLPIRSVILSAPALGVTTQIPFFKVALARGLSQIWGSLQIKHVIDAQEVTHDPAVIKNIAEDALFHDRATPRMYTETTEAMREVSEKERRITYPILFMVPDPDPVVSTPETIRFFERLNHYEKKLLRYPGFRHEIFNEGGKEGIDKAVPFEDLKAWLKANA